MSPRQRGYVAHPSKVVNASYMVETAGIQASEILKFKRQPFKLPPKTLLNVPTFLFNNSDFSKATRGRLISANITLECLKNTRGTFLCPQTQVRFNKVTYLLPQVFQPRRIDAYLDDGVIVSSPVNQNPPQFTASKFPINLVDIEETFELPALALPVPLQAPPQPPLAPQAPPPEEVDAQSDRNTPSDISSAASPASTVSIDVSQSSTFEAGYNYSGRGVKKVDRPRLVDNDEEEFIPLKTSTDPSVNAPSCSSWPAVPVIQDSPTGSPKTTPRKRSKAKLPERSDSQPAIDVFLRKTPQKERLPSPIRNVSIENVQNDGPMTRKRKALIDSQIQHPSIKRLLGDLSAEELNFCAEMAMSLEVDEPAAVEGNIDVESAIEARRSRENTPRNSPIELISITPPPQDPNDPKVKVLPVGDSSSLTPQPFLFNTQNTLHAQATLNSISTPYPEGNIPEHILLALGDNNILTHRLDFYETYYPGDIVKAFNTNDYTLTAPANTLPRRTRTPFAAPPPTPISSNEATAGSNDSTIVIESSTETINLDSSSFSFEKSQDNVAKPQEDAKTSGAPATEEEASDKEEEEEEKKEGHTK